MSGTATTPLAEYKPPKMWKDLSVEEKLERVKEQVKHIQSQQGYNMGKVQGIENDLKNHAHLDGKVVKDIKSISEGFKGAKTLYSPEAEAKGEVYF
mgnify:CR=1 FL=1